MILAAKDNSLFESPEGERELSNGAGDFLFAGRTNHPPGTLDNPTERRGLYRRALLEFDVASAIPAGARISSAVLELFVSNVSTNVPDGELETEMPLHRVDTEWGEGSSDAAQQEGTGAVAEEQDVTWFHTGLEDETWKSAGGDYAADHSALTVVGKKFVVYQWIGDRLRDDVQDCLDRPETNHGWILLGDESKPLTAKRFNSRTHPNEATRPRLIVRYTCLEARDQFAISKISVSETQAVTMSFPSRKGATYTIECSDALGHETAVRWRVCLDELLGTGEPMNVELLARRGKPNLQVDGSASSKFSMSEIIPRRNYG